MNETEPETTHETPARVSLGTATYSPEDDKLRLSFPHRLTREDYERTRAAGFIWAAKQGLFVAVWTPEREDLALELCGDEIEDEDKTLVERAEERADRFADYRRSRQAEGEAAHRAVDQIADGIPFGQPILVGHHSERRARRDAERIESGMRRAIRAFETADYWKQRAAGAIRAARYKERPDVRARRIKGLESDERKQARILEGLANARRLWSGEIKARNGAGEVRQVVIEETPEARLIMWQVVGHSSVGNYRVIPSEDGKRGWNAWDLLRPADDGRWPDTPEMTLPEIARRCLEIVANLTGRHERWREHYQNRLAYERAMLDEQGGTVADRTKPEKGGACRCWCSPSGGWSIIQKVNRVSVTLLDNWGNGGADFTRTIEFDKLRALMSAAEVDEARRCGRVLNETRRGFFLAGLPEEPKPAPAPAAPKAEDPAAKAAALRATLAAGVQVVAANQLFPTPPDLAMRMRNEADLRPGQTILEPSAGTGRLIDAILRVGEFSHLLAIECNGPLTDRLRDQYQEQRDAGLLTVLGGDFLSISPEPSPAGVGQFDRVVMNPPFERGADVQHIRHAMRFLKPGGRLVALCGAGPRQEAFAAEIGVPWRSLGPGLFKNEGTDVAVALLVWDAPGPREPLPQPAAGQLALI